MENSAILFEKFIFSEFCFTAFRHNYLSGGIGHHFIAYMRSGSCRIVSEEYTFTANEGEFFYLPMGLKYHSYWYTGDNGEVRFDSYGFKEFPRYDNITFFPQAINGSVSALEICDKLSRNREKSLVSIGLFYQLLGSLIGDMKSIKQDKKSRIVEQAEEYMRQNNECKAEEIANYCNVSQTLLYEAFKSVHGYTPVDAKQKIKISRACEMLRTTNMSVENISSILGFGTAAYFRKVFFKHTGKTPRQMRSERIL